MQNISTRKDMTIKMNHKKISKINKNRLSSLKSCETPEGRKTPINHIEIKQEKGQYILFLKSKKEEGNKKS